MNISGSGTPPLKRWFGALLAAAAMSIGVSVIAATPAHAGDQYGCRWFPQHNGEGYLTVSQNVTMRDGPYSACGYQGTLSYGKRLYVWCMGINKYDNAWFYGRLEGSSTYGWVYYGSAVTLHPDDENNNGWYELPDCITGQPHIIID